MKLKMTIDECLEFADTWSRGMTIHEDSQGWRVVCMLLAEEVRELRAQAQQTAQDYPMTPEDQDRVASEQDQYPSQARRQELSRLEPFVHGLGKAILRELMHEEAATEQAQQTTHEQIYETIVKWDEGGGKRSRRELARRIESLTQLSAPEPEPEPEPVAWMVEDIDRKHFIFRTARPEIIVGETLTPLYPAEALAAARVQALEDFKAELADALCADCENGVKYLNEQAAEKFRNDYPKVSALIGGADV